MPGIMTAYGKEALWAFMLFVIAIVVVDMLVSLYRQHRQ